MTTMISTAVMDYDKERCQLSMPSEHTAGSFPKEMDVVSYITGQIVRFVQDEQAAIRNDYWDGEQMEYIPDGSNVKVQKLIIYHAY